MIYPQATAPLAVANPLFGLGPGLGSGAEGAVLAPTLILDYNALTDPGILNGVGAPIESGFYVGTWPFTVGGTATAANANAAGADFGPLWDAVNGVSSDGTGNVAVTLPTAVTVPANIACDIWVYSYWSGAGYNFLLGRLGSSAYAALDDSLGGQVCNDAGGLSYYDGALPSVGWRMFRAGRSAAGLWTFAWTGLSETAATDSAAGTGQLRFDTLLAMDGIASGFLNNFTTSGNGQAAGRIVTYPDGYTGRAAYRSAYETLISGSPLT